MYRNILHKFQNVLNLMERIVSTIAITALIRLVTKSTEAVLMVVFTEYRAIKVHLLSFIE